MRIGMAYQKGGTWYGDSGLPLSGTVTKPNIGGDIPTAVLVKTSPTLGFVAQTTASPVLSGRSSYVNPVETIVTSSGTAVPVITSSGLSAVAVETIKEKTATVSPTTTLQFAGPSISFGEAAQATEQALQSQSEKAKPQTPVDFSNPALILGIGVALLLLSRR